MSQKYRNISGIFYNNMGTQKSTRGWAMVVQVILADPKIPLCKPSF